MTALAAAVRERAVFGSYARRRHRRRTHVRAAGLTVVLGGSAVLIARRTDWHIDHQRLVSSLRGENELQMRRIHIKLFHRGAKQRPVDRERLKRLYEIQMRHPAPGPRETYDELIASLR